MLPSSFTISSVCFLSINPPSIKSFVILLQKSIDSLVYIPPFSIKLTASSVIIWARVIIIPEVIPSASITKCELYFTSVSIPLLIKLYSFASSILLENFASSLTAWTAWKPSNSGSPLTPFWLSFSIIFEDFSTAFKSE